MAKGVSVAARILVFAGVLNLGCGQPPTVVNDGFGDYVLIPAGEFPMGDNFDEGNSDEIPVHNVSLADYYIGKYKVTNGEYKMFMDDGGYSSNDYWTAGGFGEHGETPDYWTEAEYNGGGLPGNELYPVVGVSWQEAMAYSSWLSEKTGEVYRLPTEAEWEKAARGSSQTRFPWGNKISSSYASFDRGQARDKMRLSPAGFYDGQVRDGIETISNASPYGVFDLAGNTSEWCSDWYDRGYYSRSPAVNPTGPASGTNRVLRGGGYIDSGYYQRSTSRHKRGAHLKSFKVSFRCVREF
ncbi:formylglycine-generating enzyme family protein [Gemmatimonadota bacterium]